MSRLRLFLFGPPRVEQDNRAVDVRPRKALALLIYLAVTRQPYSRDALATLLWPDSDQKTARASLRRMFYQLTQVVDKEFFDVQQEMISVAPTAEIWLDVEEFQQGVEKYSALDLDDFSSDLIGVEQLIASIELYSNDFLAGFNLSDCPEFDDWQFFYREELRQLLAQALQRLILVYETQRNYREAANQARRWLALDPMDEPVHRELMRLYALDGQQAAALRQYEECARILDEELGVPPDEETTQLYEQIRTKQLFADRLESTIEREEQVVTPPPMREDVAGSLSPSILHVASSNLPDAPTLFIGREAELVQLHDLLTNPRCRLITLVGLGGIGKTQLALQGARRLLASGVFPFSDGMVFIPLLEVKTVHALPFALADALNLSLLLPIDPMQQLNQFLHSRQMLLILDSVEHLLYSGSDQSPSISLINFLGAMIENCPGVKLLVTSREPLLMQVEWRMDLKGLDYPNPLADEPSGESMYTWGKHKSEEYSAIQLFVQIAQQSLPDFRITPENKAAIYRLCQLVAGMPLALKLAAGWVRLLSIDRIVDELARNFDFLSTHMRDVPLRQRNLRAVFDYTWDLLSPVEQSALQALSIFHGGFSEDAAIQVADVPPHLLAGLHDRGLLQVQASAGENRYWLHELVRQYAGEKLNALPELALAIHRRHSTYYLNLLQSLDVYLQGRNTQTILQTIQQNLDNIRAAWNRILEQGDVKALFQAQAPLYRFYWTRCRAREGKEVFTDAITQLTQMSTQSELEDYLLLLRAFIQQRGLFNYFLGDYRAATDDFHSALEIARQLGMPLEIGQSLIMLGTVARCQAKRSIAEDYLYESLKIFQTFDHKSGEADALQELSLLYAYFGEYEKAIQLAAESLSVSRELERPDWIAWALDTLGWISFISGEYEKARRCYEESLAIFKSIGHQLGTSLALGGLGIVGWAIGGNQNLAEAQSYLEESMQICRRIGHQLHLASRLYLLAQIDNDLEEYASAQAYAQEGLELARSLDSALFEVCNLCCLAESAYYQGDFIISRGYLYEAIEVASNTRLRSPLMIVLFHLATGFIIESELAVMDEAERAQKQVEALELLARVEQEETCWHIYRWRSQQRRAELLRKLPATVIEIAGEKKETRTLEAQVATLLAEEKSVQRRTAPS